MSDYQIQQREIIDDSDYGYNQKPYCTTCKTSDHIIVPVIGYEYCTKCQDDLDIIYI